jgi:anaerobic selenocysteine-containing dehydrogenase
VIAADQQRVLRGLSRDDLFTVVHDQFLTDTARFADLVLPATTMLEHADVVGSWGFSYLSWNEAAIAPIGESKSNAEVTRLLAARLGFDEEVFRLDDHQLMELAAGTLAESLRGNGYIRVGEPIGTSTPATFAFTNDALAHAHLHPTAEYRPPTAVPAEGSPRLRLLTLKRHHSINSSYAQLPVLLKAEPEQTCEIHPDDAAARGIVAGDPVEVWNELGTVPCIARVTDAVPRGTMAVPFGRAGVTGANTLTSDALGDLAGGPTFCDNLVDVRRVGAPA